MKEVLAERDKFRKHTSDLLETKHKLIREKENMMETFKKKINEMVVSEILPKK